MGRGKDVPGVRLDDLHEARGKATAVVLGGGYRRCDVLVFLRSGGSTPWLLWGLIGETLLSCQFFPSRHASSRNTQLHKAARASQHSFRVIGWLALCG